MVLKSSFSRIFYLAIKKMTTVAEMYSLGWRGRTVMRGSVCYYLERMIKLGSVVRF